MEKNMARALRPDSLWRWQEETSNTDTKNAQQYVKDMLRMQASMFRKHERTEKQIA
ncbi:MAG TPA: hypothetical protein VJ246_00140 [Patescibacteria group bacterium]|nr:hypothetical protein [Patescibacteria group bacterium]